MINISSVPHHCYRIIFVVTVPLSSMLRHLHCQCKSSLLMYHHDYRTIIITIYVSLCYFSIRKRTIPSSLLLCYQHCYCTINRLQYHHYGYFTISIATQLESWLLKPLPMYHHFCYWTMILLLYHKNLYCSIHITTVLPPLRYILHQQHTYCTVP